MNQELLNKYWEGETTLQEEQQLLNELSSSTGPDSLYFRMIAEARKEKSSLTIQDIHHHNQSSMPAPGQARVLPLYRWVASAAAVLIFCIAAFGLWNYTHQATKPVQMADSFEDPYQAYEEVREALAFVSAKLNKSQSEALINIKKAGTYAEMFK